MNYMKDVAKLLGVEIGEEFKTNKTKDYSFKILEDNLYFYDFMTKKWMTSYKLSDILSGKYEIIKLSILDKVEKKYLYRIVRPFRNDVEYICKCRCGKYDCIEIGIHSDIEESCFTLPKFKQDTMYKGMEYGKEYSLEELGL